MGTADAPRVALPEPPLRAGLLHEDADDEQCLALLETACAAEPPPLSQDWLWERRRNGGAAPAARDPLELLEGTGAAGAREYDQLPKALLADECSGPAISVAPPPGLEDASVEGTARKIAGWSTAYEVDKAARLEWCGTQPESETRCPSARECAEGDDWKFCLYPYEVFYGPTWC